MTEAPALTAEQTQALDVARRMAAAGIPLFIAQPAPSVKTGFVPPRGWERTEPDPAVVDQWRPGLALCAVMGRGLDLTDIDPRNGGDLATLNGHTPHVYGAARTPSGGTHLFIASLGTGSRDNVFPGIDVKSGLPDGSGRGFAFLAPTVRASVVTGEAAAYRWVQAPERVPGPGEDGSGAALAARIRELRTGSNALRNIPGGGWSDLENGIEFLTAHEPQSTPAADRAIETKLAEVAEWSAEGGEGFRTALLRAALTLGGYVGGGHLEEADARRRLEEVVGKVWGSPDADDQLWIQQGLDDGTVQPFRVFTPEQEREFSEAGRAQAREGEERPSADDDAEPPVDPPWNVFGVLDPATPFDPAGDSTDQGLAKAVAYRMFPALRYGADAGTWVKRGPDVWDECPDDMSDWVLAILAELMPLGQAPVPKDAGDRTEAHWQAVRRAQFMSSAGAGKIARKLRALVRSDHPATVRVAELDSNPEVLWAGAVPWDLRACGDVPTPAYWVDPNTPHLRSALCAPDPTVATPRWDAFCAAVLPDPEIRAWALRVLAVSMTGHADAVLPVLFGRERSGKTSLVEMLVQVLGSYANAANPKLLSGDSSHDAIVYDLKGRRLAFIDEGPKRGHDATERLKQLTGGGSLTANQMRANPITFRPTHTLVMTTNNEPHLTDPALRARMRLIPCDAEEDAVRAARIPLLGPGLHAEAPGVIAALMREAAGYLADRDSASTAAAPISIRGLTAEMAQGQDPVREWVTDCTVPAEPGTTGRTLFTTFARWHQDNPLFRRLSVPSETAFGRTLTEMGYPPHKINGLVHRSLSVLQGPSGYPGTVPTPAAYMGVTQGGLTPAREGLGEGSGGFEPQPSTAGNPSSGPVFSETPEGREGFSPVPESKSLPTTTHRNTGGKGPEPSTRREPSAKPPLTSDDAARRVESANPPETLRDGPQDSDPDSSQPVTNTTVAAKADQDKITKAEARAQLKAETRLAAIAEAGGPVLPLPAVVDRNGTVAPLSVADAEGAVRIARAGAGALTVDVETSGYPVGHPDYALRSVQLGAPGMAVVFDPADPAQAQAIARCLAEAGRLHAHSATADLVPLSHAGLIEADSAWARMHDTVIPAKLADPASTGSDPGLKQLAGAVLGEHATAPAADAARSALFKAGKWLTNTKPETPPERSGWAQVATGSTVMLRYAASDVLDTAALAQALPAPGPDVLERERLAQRMTARVTHAGVRLDAEHIATLTERHTGERQAASGRVRAFGIDNPGSNPQVATALGDLGAPLPRTKTGTPSVAVSALEPLSKRDDEIGRLAAAVLEYRHHDTVLGTFLTPYRELCERGDGRARPTVYTLGTDTGRMSCVRPNLQQLPRTGGVRACITADPGQMLISADFSGVELRVAAALSQDPTLLRFIAEGRDLHAEVARQVWGDSAGKAERYAAKRIVFGRLYGGGIPTLAAQGGVSESIAASAVETLDAITPQLARWSAAIRDAVKGGRTQFPTYAGRVIHLPREYPHKAPNYCLTPDTPILRADLRHVPAAEIGVGDRLVAFDEYPANGGGRNDYRRMRTAVVEAASTVRKASVTVRTADGKATTCSADHLWLVRPRKLPHRGSRNVWVKAEDLRPGDALLSLGTWDEAASRTAGYLAGLYDGEGSLASRGHGNRSTGLTFAQLRGPVMDAFCAGMGSLGLSYGYHGRAPASTSPTDLVQVSGVRKIMRTLGTLQPHRFRDRFEGVYEGAAITAGLTESVAVTSVDDAGVRVLTSIQTSTRTLVANGYLSHNCIQGTARELLVDALTRWTETRWGASVLLPVHDELVVAVPAADAEEATAELVRCMGGQIHGVTIVADPSAPAFAWADST